jgi:hypothetical protein
MSPSHDLDTSAAVDEKNLYQEETFTDLKVATIRRLTPVLPGGAPDPARKMRFSGHTQIMTPGGALPLQFDLDAEDLAGAFRQFPKAVETAIQQLAEEMEKLQRERSSRIISPNEGGGSKLVLPR